MTGTLVYDADCGFCTRCADWVRGRSSAEVVPWQSLDLPAVGLTEDDVTTAAYWLEEGRTPARGARSIAAALRSCGGVWAVLGRLIDLPPARPFAALGYRVVARYRYRLPGGTAACKI